MRLRTIAGLLVLVICMLFLCACGESGDFPFSVYVLDVGQGDAILIRSGEQTMLIDAGPNDAEEELLFALDELDVDALDIVIFTHPDEDHIGGGDGILANFAVGEVMISPLSSTENSFLRLLSSADAHGVAVSTAEAGHSFALDDAQVTLLGPTVLEGMTSNDASIIVRVEFGKVALLLMGDTELEGEEALLNAYSPELLRADLLKLGHHGAATSTSSALLDAVQPTFAAISCGEGNTYGHPSRSVINALTEREIAIGRTDRDGMLVYVSDGAILMRQK